MKTEFTLAQLADPDFARSNDILRKCVHCGFCTATCPTYLELGDERDSPRGRIYLMQRMLESGAPAPASTVTHLDRCLGCFSCMTTCPSGVDYMHLLEHGRAYVEETYRRPLADRAFRALLALLLPRPKLFRIAVGAARCLQPFKSFLKGRLRAMLEMAPASLPPASELTARRLHEAKGARRARVALMTGCVQGVLSPEIHDATIRLLTRHGVEVIVPQDSGCCGAMTLHMGNPQSGRAFAARNIRAFAREMAGEGLDAIIINTSGCGTTVKDYGNLFAHEADAKLRDEAKKVSAIACDITEFLERIDLHPLLELQDLKVAYHAACSLQHGQRVREAPKALLRKAGFTVVDIPEGHICCGSAGTYNLLESELAGRLKARKAENISRVAPDLVAAGNIGCIVQIGSAVALPVVHTVELLDWASGGPKPPALMRSPAA